MNETNRNNSLPNEFELFQNYPNPFNATTAITIYLPPSIEVELNVLNVRGELVKTLQKGLGTNGYQVILWDGTDRNGVAVSSGIYVISLKSRSQYETIKAILLR